MGEDGWNSKYETAFAIALSLAECELLTGQLTAADERWSRLSTLSAQLRFIHALRGLTTHLASFDGPGFGEHEFEQRLDRDPGLAAAKFLYWVRKLQAHLYAGDYGSAAAAAAQVQDGRWRKGASGE